MIYDQANTPSLSQWLGASLYLLAHLPHWVALFHASGGSNLRSSGSIYPQYSGFCKVDREEVFEFDYWE